MMPSLLAYFFALFIIFSIEIVEANSYPKDALQCHATSSPLENGIVCPRETKFCVKQITTSSRQNCGKSIIHPFDEWDVKEGKCVYRKCGASECVDEEVTTFLNDDSVDERKAFCCSGKLCNASSIRFASFGVMGTVLIAALVL